MSELGVEFTRGIDLDCVVTAAVAAVVVVFCEVVGILVVESTVVDAGVVDDCMVVVA